MWSCAGNRKRLNAYIDGELPKRVRRSVELHLGACPSCRRVFDDLCGLAPLLENYDAPPVPAGLSSRVLAEAASRQRRKAYGNEAGFGWLKLLFKPWLVRSATTAALVVGLAMGAWMGWTSHRSPESKQWVVVTNNDGVAETLYTFDVLSAEPRGSIEAATLALVGDER